MVPYETTSGARCRAVNAQREYEEPVAAETEASLYGTGYETGYEAYPEPGKGSLLDDYERIMGHRLNEETGLYEEGQYTTEPLEVVELEDEGTDYIEIIKNFDPGKAVIYSAILNRIEY